MEERTAQHLPYIDARIAHDYWTVDDDIVWEVVETHAPQLHHELADEIGAARAVLDIFDD
jgi:uncharacterized protein with HEPN domain